MFVDCQLVVEKQLVTDKHITRRINEDTTIDFHSDSVGVTRVIQPPHAVAAATAVDHSSIVETEQKRMAVHTAKATTTRSPTPAHHLAWPVYSRIRSLSRIADIANTPLPCTGDRLTMTRLIESLHQKLSW
jgi:hypothetical protein